MQTLHYYRFSAIS